MKHCPARASQIEIARALASRPQFILLDEPFAGVDPISVDGIRRIVTFLRDQGIGVLITDHSVREALSICNRGYIVNEGHIISEGSPSAIAADTQSKTFIWVMNSVSGLSPLVACSYPNRGPR